MKLASEKLALHRASGYVGIPHRETKIQFQIGSEELLHLFINQRRLMVEDQRGKEEIKQATIQYLGPKS